MGSARARPPGAAARRDPQPDPAARASLARDQLPDGSRTRLSPKNPRGSGPGICRTWPSGAARIVRRARLAPPVLEIMALESRFLREAPTVCDHDVATVQPNEAFAAAVSEYRRCAGGIGLENCGGAPGVAAKELRSRKVHVIVSAGARGTGISTSSPGVAALGSATLRRLHVCVRTPS